jgi:hypothetical protein
MAEAIVTVQNADGEGADIITQGSLIGEAYFDTNLPLVPDSLTFVNVADEPIPQVFTFQDIGGGTYAHVAVLDQGVLVRAGSGGEEMVNQLIGPGGIAGVGVGGDQQYFHVGIDSVGYVGGGLMPPNGNAAFVRVGDSNFADGDEFNASLINLSGLPSSSSNSSASNDNLTMGSGGDSVVALGNATAAGLGGALGSLGVESITAAAPDALAAAAGSGSSSTQASDAFALGADSLAAAQVVADFASAPAEAVAPVVDTAVSAVGAVVSMDDGLTTIAVNGVSKLGSPFGG